MKKEILLALVLQVTIIANTIAQKTGEQYVVLSGSSDTLYCDDLSKAMMGGYKCAVGGKEAKYKTSDIRVYAIIEKGEYRRYERHPVNPKKSNKNQQFMEVMLENDEYKLLNYVEELYGGGNTNMAPGQKPVDPLLNPTFGGAEKYYIYKTNDEFVSEVKKKDKETLNKYFGESKVKMSQKGKQTRIERFKKGGGWQF